MVKILGVCGSPRKGATEYALSVAMEAAAATGNVETKTVLLRGRNIQHCIACDKCLRENQDRCMIYHDDMDELYDIFYETDAIIIASPVYVMNYTATLAAYLNRFRSAYLKLVDNPAVFSHKVGSAIAVGGMRNGGQEMTINAIHNFYNSFGLTIVNGGLGAYAGASVWSQNKKAQGVKEDELGLKWLELIGRNTAEKAKIFHEYKQNRATN